MAANLSTAIGRRCSDYAARIQEEARAFWSVATSAPWIILGVPLLTFLILVAGAVLAVVLSAKGAEQHARDHAAALARGAASQYQQQLAFGSSAVEVLAAVVRANPSYDRVALRFKATAPALVKTAPTGAISSLRLFPSGRLRMVYPLNETAENMMGFDVLADRGPQEQADIGDRYADAVSFIGPVQPLPGREDEGPLLLVGRAIYVPLPADPHDNFGRPDKPNPLCGDPCTYNQTRGTIFWGLVISEVRVHELDGSFAAAASQQDQSSPHLTPAESALRALSDVGYAYCLKAANGVVVASSGEGAPRDPVTASLDLPGSVWELHVWRQEGSWTPAWFGGVLAAVIVLAAVAALLLCRMLVSRRRHAMLLEALLPRDLLKELSATHAETLGPAGPLDAGSSPAGMLLELLGGLLEGSPPDLRQVVLLRSLALRQADWYHPLGMAQAIKRAHLESDVARALMRQLGTGMGADSEMTTSNLDLGTDFGQTDEEDGGDGDSRKRRAAASGAAAGGQSGRWGLPDAAAGGAEQRQQQQEPLDTLRGALAFVLSPAAQAQLLEPLSARAQPVAAAAAGALLDYNRCQSNGAAAAAGLGTVRRRRRPSSQLDVMPIGSGGGSGANGSRTAAQQSVPLSGAAMAAVSAADIDTGDELAAAAAELLETTDYTDEVEPSAFGLRSYTLLRPPSLALQQQQQQPQTQPRNPQPQQAGAHSPLLQSSTSISVAGLVMHRADSQQQQAARRSGWLAQLAASVSGPLGTAPAGTAAGSRPLAGGTPADVVVEGAAAGPSSGSSLLLNAAAGLLAGRRTPSVVASSAGSPRAQPALMLAAGSLRQQPQQQSRAHTPTYPTLLAPQTSVPSVAAVVAPATAGSRLLHSLQLHIVAQPVSTPAKAAAASSSGADRGRRGSLEPEYESCTQQQQQQKGLHQAVPSPRSQPVSAVSSRAFQQHGSGSVVVIPSAVAAAAAPLPSSSSALLLSKIAAITRWPGAAATRNISGIGHDDGGDSDRGGAPRSRSQRQRPVSSSTRQREVSAEGDGEESALDVLEGVEEGEMTLCNVHHEAMPVHVVSTAPPPAALLDQVELLLAGAHEWQFDSWALAEASGGHALSVMGFYLLQREGLVAAFRIQPVKLARLLRALEEGYPASNPYHNATHAADVLRTLSVLLRGARLTAHYAHGLGLLASYFAAIVHDHGHPGLTGDFLVATSHPLALRYNDRSPLESHHAASSFTLLAERPDLDAFAELTREQRASFRKQVVDMVLATDMKQHFSLLTQFTTLQKARKAVGANTSLGASGNGLTAAAAGDTSSHEAPAGQQPAQPQQGTQRALRPPMALNRGGAIMSGGSNVITELKPATTKSSFSSLQHQASQLQQEPLPDPAPSPQDEAERSLTLQVALKAADIGHLAAALPVHCRWLGVLEEEFFRQGDKEKALGLPISPLFDRAKQGVSKSQVGFFDFVALPLVRALADAFPGAAALAGCFETNYNHWKKMEADLAAAQQHAQVAQQKPPVA